MNENIKLAAERAVDFVNFGGVASNPLTAEAHIKGLAKLIKTLVAESDKEAVRNAALDEAIDACLKVVASKDAERFMGKASHYAACAGAIEALKSQPAQPSDTEPTNTGHGHVFPRADGVRARCGGPGVCSECSRDAARKAGMQTQPSDIQAKVSDTEKDAVRNAALPKVTWWDGVQGDPLTLAESLDNYSRIKPGGSREIWAMQAAAKWIREALKSQPAQPSDTEMLDWIVEHEAIVRVFGDGSYECAGIAGRYYAETPSEAIKAAMRADREGS